jgi:hypothetical protein
VAILFFVPLLMYFAFLTLGTAHALVVTFPDVRADTWASWAQAVGSVGAIGAAIWAVHAQARSALLQEWSRRESDLMGIIEIAQNAHEMALERNKERIASYAFDQEAEWLRKAMKLMRDAIALREPVVCAHLTLVIEQFEEIIVPSLTRRDQITPELDLQTGARGASGVRIERALHHMNSRIDYIRRVLAAHRRTRP